MAKFSYNGPESIHNYHSTPSGREYTFVRGSVLEVNNDKDVECFRKLVISSGGAFKEEGVIADVKNTAEKVAEKITPRRKK